MVVVVVIGSSAEARPINRVPELNPGSVVGMAN